ncbi:MAG TPA: hypothetical protein VKU00_05485, partial [Chthonomonadaceae bacterium]|nr:hypothetical protein [Chthonomonadaceae bacterium]
MMPFNSSLRIASLIVLIGLALGAGTPGVDFGAPAPGRAANPTVYHVGPPQIYTKVTEVPWEKLNPGDTVYIHWRAEGEGGDYHEKINLTRSGTPDAPIRILGVKGPHGERPCLNGKDAITRTIDPEGNSTYFAGNQERGVLCFSARNKSGDQTPGASYWSVSGLKITGARPANDFTDSFGKRGNYQRNQGGLGSAGAGVFIDRGNYLRFSDMELTDNNNGFFASSDNKGAEARHVHDILLENSLLYGNGAPNNASVHNAYVEVANWTVRNNYFGPLVPNSGGSHIKDRGANTVIEGNFFDGTAVPLFLDPPEFSLGWMEKQPGFEKLTLRNNVIRKTDDLPVNAMDLIITGFDVYGDIPTVRTVDISHNTFILTATRQHHWSFNVLDLIPRPQVIAWNDNVFLRYVEGKEATPSGVTFVSKINTVDEKTIIRIGPNNYLSAQDPLEEQKAGNGNATIQGWETLHRLPDMSLAQLEATLGINLHDASVPDFGRFHATTNAWYGEHKAGATYDAGTSLPPTLRAGQPVTAQEKPAAEVTLKGNVLCLRAMIPVSWNGSQNPDEHIPVLYAFEGTPEITAQVKEILNKGYPAKGLDVEAAQKLLDAFTARLAYYVAPGELTIKLHKEVEWRSQVLALTGTVYEKDGRKWIALRKYEKATLSYP